MIIEKLVVGELQANCYIVADEKSGRALVIDPGEEAEKILGVITQNELKVIYIVNTHAHIDHIGANDIIREKTSASLLIHPVDAHLLENIEMNLSIMTNKERRFLPPTRMIRDGDEVKLDQICLQVLHTPGHTPGSICLYIKDERVFSGDTLFSGSVGRVDLPGGSFIDLQNSIREKLLTLPRKVIVHPGHGPDTTIGKEKKSNPFINIG